MTHKLFQKDETISEIANMELKKILKNYKAKKVTAAESIFKANELGDSIEKLIVINEIKHIELESKSKKMK
ncbi:hypothetical protein [Pedobacter sp. NJ-S-72]